MANRSETIVLDAAIIAFTHSEPVINRARPLAATVLTPVETIRHELIPIKEPYVDQPYSRSTHLTDDSYHGTAQ